MSTPTPVTATGDPVGLDSPEFLADPFPFYERLRRESPVYRTKMAYLGDTEIYLLSRYSDCVDLTTDHRFRRVVEGAPPLPIPDSLKLISTTA
jgi:cytochrome P450